MKDMTPEQKIQVDWAVFDAGTLCERKRVVGMVSFLQGFIGCVGAGSFAMLVMTATLFDGERNWVAVWGWFASQVVSVVLWQFLVRIEKKASQDFRDDALRVVVAAYERGVDARGDGGDVSTAAGSARE